MDERNIIELSEEEEERIVEEILMAFEEDKRNAIELIKSLDEIDFTEHQSGENTIGYIQDHWRTISVDFLEDNLGKYLKLSFVMEVQGDSDILMHKLSLWLKSARFKLNGGEIELYQIFPLLDERFLLSQVKHALSEIWDMSGVVKLN